MAGRGDELDMLGDVGLVLRRQSLVGVGGGDVPPGCRGGCGRRWRRRVAVHLLDFCKVRKERCDAFESYESGNNVSIFELPKSLMVSWL